MGTRVTERGAFAIAAHEGLVPTRYLDLAGVDTYGVGHTHNAGAPDPRKMSFDMPPSAQVSAAIRSAWTVYRIDLEKYTDDVIDFLGAEMAPHELDGWVTWHFNTGGLWQTSAVRLWRAGRRVEAVETLKQWNKVTRNGRKIVSQALVKRRDEEADMILRGRYPARPLNIWPTNGKGRVIWKPMRVYTDHEFREFISGNRETRVPTPGGGGLGAAILVALGAAVGVAATWWDNIIGALPW